MYTMTFDYLNAQHTTVPKAASASTCVHFPPINIPEDKLLHFDSQIRVRNSFMVAFKCDDGLIRDVSQYSALRTQILPEKMPTNEENCVLLAKAYVARFGGHLRGVWFNGALRGFGISDISDASIAILAMDDRVEYVEPDMVAVAQ
jgi:hypothetical protein